MDGSQIYENRLWDLLTEKYSITCAGIAGQSAFHEYPAGEVKKIVDINVRRFCRSPSYGKLR